MYNAFTFFFLASRHVGYWFPDQGLNLCPPSPTLEAWSCNHWTTREISYAFTSNQFSFLFQKLFSRSPAHLPLNFIVAFAHFLKTKPKNSLSFFPSTSACFFFHFKSISIPCCLISSKTVLKCLHIVSCFPKPVSLWSLFALVVKNLPASPGDIRDMGSIPGLGRSLE